MPRLGSDRFELVRPAGEGSYGVVYEARDRLHGGRVAVKVLFDESGTAQERFDREVALLSDLHHPSIVHYVAHGVADDGQRYLVMEWLEGVTLKERLDRGPIPVADVIALASRVVMGLTFAEARGIVHRDIKPGNLFLVNGAADAAKLLDFGIALRVTDNMPLTATGLAIGTPKYMSPEQARGEILDARSDVFSLGSVLYECLAGVSPFDAPQAMATLAKICFEDAPRIEARVPEVPASLAGLIHAMLHKDREDRPRLGDIAQALRDIDTPDGGNDLASTRRSLHPRRRRADQRILVAVFVGASERLPGQTGAELEQVIARYGGRMERLLDGSRILLPAQHLGASEQVVVAAQCALAVNEMLARRAPIVVCTGRALLGEQQNLGELFERGAALLGSAPAGRVRVDDASAALLDARFELAGDEPGGPVLLRERSGGEAPRTVLGQTTAFVGRERELAMLLGLIAACREDRTARAVLVVAPAGAGKSRLRHELLERLQEEERGTLLRARGDSMLGGTPFGVLSPALLAWAEITGTDPDALRRSKLFTRVSALLGPVRAGPVAAFLGEMAGVHFPNASSAELAAARSAPQLMADHMLSSWLEWLEALSAAAPVLVCVEDLHWSDPASVRFLDAALRSVGERALCVIAFARPEVRDAFPSLWAERDLTELRLSKLPPRACARLLEALGGVALSESQRASVIERADGNPFFLEELVRALKSARTGELLPDTILGIVQARLDALGEEPKQLVRAASVFGQTFHVAGLRALFGADAAHFDFHRWLALLCEREVIFARGGASAEEYAFRHAILRDAAYVLLPPEERALGHRLAGAWLEQSGDDPALLADHFERGGVGRKAAQWYTRAAAHAFDAGSLADVMRFGERAVVCGVAGEEAGELAAVLAEASSYREDDVGAAAWAERARAVLDPGSPAWWRATQVGAVAHLRRGNPEFEMLAMHMVANYDRNSPLPEQALAVAYASGESLRLMREEVASALLALLPASLPDALKGRPQGCLESAYAVRAFRQGNLSDALRHAREALAAQRRARSLRDIADSLGLCGYVLHELGQYADAETCLLEEVQLGQRIGSQRDVLYGQLNLGSIYARLGRLSDAERMLSEASRHYEALGLTTYLGEALCHLMGVRIALGNLDGARAIAERAQQMTGFEPSADAYLLAATSRLALCEARLDDACDLSARAEELVSRHGLTEFVGIILLARVAALRASGDQAAAQALAAALEWLAGQAAKIDDPALRASFLTQVPEHAELRALATRGEPA